MKGGYPEGKEEEILHSLFLLPRAGTWHILLQPFPLPLCDRRFHTLSGISDRSAKAHDHVAFCHMGSMLPLCCGFQLSSGPYFWFRARRQGLNICPYTVRIRTRHRYDTSKVSDRCRVLGFLWGKLRKTNAFRLKNKKSYSIITWFYSDFQEFMILRFLLCT